MGPDWALQVPDGYSKISTGILTRDGSSVLTGHENGYVTRWALDDPEPQIILRTISPVQSIVEARDGNVWVGCHAGDLYRLAGSDYAKVDRVLPPTNSKYDRIWQMAEPLPGRLLFTSTYGRIEVLEQREGEWKSTKLEGHTDSVFAVSHIGDSLLATGDYRGRIRIWKHDGDTFEPAGRLAIGSLVAGLAFLSESLLTAIARNGQVFIFSLQEATGTWRSVFETEAASGIGAAVQADPTGKRALAVTPHEIIEIDPESQEVRTASVKGGISILPSTKSILLLTKTGVLRISEGSLQPKLDLIRYEYLKVALLGTTGAGKTTLCSQLATGNAGQEKATFGRRTWSWTVEEGPPQRRILLNDTGGQEQVTSTLLPLAADSDVALYFFQQTDPAALRASIDLLRRMRNIADSQGQSFFVQTHTDHEMQATPDEQVHKQVENYGLDGIFKVAPIDDEDVDRFKDEFRQRLDWTQARKAVLSASADALTTLIEELRKEGKTAFYVDDLWEMFKERTGRDIYKYHLTFLLRNMSDAGQLEYYSSVGDTIVLDDPEFNRLRTEIPIFVQEKGGIVAWDDVRAMYPDHSTYLAMLDAYYQSNGISIEFGRRGGRLFPGHLESRPLAVPEDVADYLKTSDASDVDYPAQDENLPVLLRGLCDLDLACLDATKEEGVFAAGSNAFLYYKIKGTQSLLDGPSLNVRYVTSGPSKDTAARLKQHFENLARKLYRTQGSL